MREPQIRLRLLSNVMPETLNTVVIDKNAVQWDEAAYRVRYVLFVTFEQGRGDGGVPRWDVVVPGGEFCQLKGLIKITCAIFRVLCAESHAGKDLMPGTDDDYTLHKTSGIPIKELSEINFVKVNDHLFTAKAALVYKSPNRLLMRELEGPESL